MLSQPVKQFSNNVGLLNNVIVVSEERFAKAFDSILVIPELIIIDVTVDTSVELTPVPMVKILTPPSDVGIVRAVSVDPVTLVMLVRTFAFEMLKIKLYPASTNCELSNPAANISELL
jgi:hypothetical protein